MASPSVPKAASFVIIGGGTAGLVLANRLSEDPKLNIVVFESGKNLGQDPQVQDPNLWMSLLGENSAWQLESVPQVSHCCTSCTSNVDIDDIEAY